jgi:hypothetical protein
MTAWSNLRRIASLTLALSAATVGSSHEMLSDQINLASMNPEQTWVPTVLVPWVNYGADFGGVSAWNVSGISKDQTVDSWFALLSQNGVRIIAWFLFGDGRGALTFDGAGYVTGLAPSFLSDYESILSRAKKHNLQIIWVLTDFEIGMPLEAKGGVQEFGRSDLLEDPTKRKSLIENGLESILKAAGTSEEIAGWIVMNEPEHLLRSGYVSESAIRSFIQDAASAIKRYNPDQRIAIANSDFAAMVQLSDLRELDFLVLHDYQSHLPPPAKMIRASLRDRFGSAVAERPIFIGEFDLSSPPGSDIDKFLRATRALGYAGAWPWSLRNDIHKVGEEADINAQFIEVDKYAHSVLSLKTSGKLRGHSNTREMRQWVLTQMNSKLLPDIDRRIIQLHEQPVQHQKETEINQEWADRTQHQLDADRQNLEKLGLQEKKAVSDIKENQDWLSRAGASDLSVAQAALSAARNWQQEIETQIQCTQDEVLQLQVDLAAAVARSKMHSYLARETASELDCLALVRRQLRDKKLLQSVIKTSF